MGSGSTLYTEQTQPREVQLQTDTQNQLQILGSLPTVPFLNLLSTNSSEKLLEETGYDGAEVHPTNIFVFELIFGRLRAKTLEYINAMHQSYREEKDNLAGFIETLKHANLFNAILSRILFEEQIKSLETISLLQIRRTKFVKDGLNPLPVVLFPRKPAQNTHRISHKYKASPQPGTEEKWGFKEKIFQITPEILKWWEFNIESLKTLQGVKDFIKLSRKHGYTGICIDTHFSRRIMQIITDSDTDENAAGLLLSFTTEIHLSLGRTDKEVAGVYKESIAAEFKAILKGDDDSYLPMFLKLISRKYGWKGRMVVEIPYLYLVAYSNSENINSSDKFNDRVLNLARRIDNVTRRSRGEWKRIHGSIIKNVRRWMED